MRIATTARLAFLTAAIAAVALLLLAGCASGQYRYRTEAEVASLLAESTPFYPPARFAVISDLHIYDTTLGSEGEAFQEYLARDRKLLVEGREILQTASNRILDSDVDFIIVPGDLTKDGELASHLMCAEALGELEEGGKNVYVVPGNHDVQNPHALSYSVEGVKPVETVDALRFAQIYHEYGYGEALSRDPVSLSYVAEPTDGLLLLAIDSCDYEQNGELDDPVVAGRLRAEQIAWIEQVLLDAVRDGKAVVAMMHHGLIEHYDSQAKHFGDYVLADYQQIGRMLAAYGVRVVFTGHYHAQDIVRADFTTGLVYDVETGSLVTYPCPIRFVSVQDGIMAIRSERITQIPSFAERKADFADYARDTVFRGINDIAVETMVGLGMQEAEARGLSGQITEAFLAHYQGDEEFIGQEMIRLRGLSLTGRLVVGIRKDLVYGLWEDLEPPDDSISIDLVHGSWTRH